MFDVKTGGSGYINGEEPNTPTGIIEIFHYDTRVCCDDANEVCGLFVFFGSTKKRRFYARTF
jgi:hypothetical protein